MKVIGLDLSLTSTGLADARAQHTRIVRPGSHRGYGRLRHLRGQILDACTDADLVVIEGPSYESTAGQKGHHERAGLWWFIAEALDGAGVPLAIAAPSVVKKYATGKGNAPKDDVLVAATRRFDWFTGRNDEADALWLSALGYDLGGDPAVVMPATNRGMLEKVEWPQLAA